MTRSEDIHRSITEADDLESIHQAIPLGEVLRSLISHPAQIITRWNWKSALLGAILRASFYFTVYKASRENWLVTLTAVMVELAFRFFTSGISGALVQSFRRATPQWLATLVVTVSLPIFSHSVEFFTHYVQETYFNTIFPASVNHSRQRAFAISVLFSIMSAMFNLFAMRKGVLLVGAGSETKSLWGDIKTFPILIFDFVVYIPILIIDSINNSKFINAIGIFAAFGLAIGSILGGFRGKWSWAWTTALGAWAIMFVWTILVALGMRIFKNRQA